MRTNVKRNKSGLILALLLFVLAGSACSRDAVDGNLGENMTVRQSNEMVFEDIKIYTMYSEDINRNDVNFSNAVAQAITKATGVKLDIEYPVEDVDKKVGIMIASGDYPDLIMVKETAKFVDANAYLDLTDLINTYGPNLKKLYGDDMGRLKYSETDSAIYVLPSSPIGETKWEPAMGFNLQHAVVKELGYPKLETVEDFEKAIMTYKQAHPMINGQATIGLLLVADDWRWHITFSNGAGFATGAPDDGSWYVDPMTYETTYRFLRAEEKEYYRWLNHMYDIGLLDPDSFVLKYEAYEAKIASGRVLGLIDAKWQYSDAEKVLETKGMEERTYGQYPIQLDKKTKAADFREAGYLGGYGIGISVNCQDPVGAIRFLDYLASEEGQILRQWGIEGTHHYYDDNGVRHLTPEMEDKSANNPNFARETGVGVYVYPFPTYGGDMKDSTGNAYAIWAQNTEDPDYFDIEEEILSAYGVKTWGDLYPQKDELPKSDWGSAWLIPLPEETGINAILARCNDIMKEGIVEAIISEPEAFDDVWTRLMEELQEAGVYEMNAKFTELVKRKVKSWE